MKKLLLFMTIFANFVFAETKNFELGLFPHIQLGSYRDSVSGLRLGLFYTENRNVTGLEGTFWSSKTTGYFNGLKLGGISNTVEKGGNVIQLLGFVSDIHGDVNIVQSAVAFSLLEDGQGVRLFNFINYSENMRGFDLGGINFSKNMEGLQIGIFNYAGHLMGTQIGLINYAKNSSIFPIMPFFNKGE